MGEVEIARTIRVASIIGGSLSVRLLGDFNFKITILNTVAALGGAVQIQRADQSIPETEDDL